MFRPEDGRQSALLHVCIESIYLVVCLLFGEVTVSNGCGLTIKPLIDSPSGLRHWWVLGLDEQTDDETANTSSQQQKAEGW